MCGIAGIIGQHDESVMKNMLSSIAHRGPDDSGFERFTSIGRTPAILGHRRLSIIDLRRAGRQPMSNEDGRWWITYNGEIYNFAALRKQLQSLGHKFRSRTDTEVLVHGWEQWGEELIPKLIGMFAFAIFDAQESELILVRDRLGIKPLYYAQTANSFAFASEVKALLEVPGISAEMSTEALTDFLTFGYVAGELTMFKGIYKLQPGSLLRLHNFVPSIKAYWSLPSAEPAEESFDLQAEKLSALLSEAVSDRLIADVPLGSFLSGGLDSSVVSALIAKSRDDLKTFCVGYSRSESRHDERETAQQTADHLRTSHKGFECTDDYAVNSLARLIWHMDEPIAEQLLAPYAKLCEGARQDVTVVLSGEGADEFLYGYRYYGLEKLRSPLSNLPSGFRGVLKGAIGRYFDRNNLRVRAALTILQDTSLNAMFEWSTLFNSNEICELVPSLEEPGSTSLELFANYSNQLGNQGVDIAPSIDARFRMVDYILTRTDKLSMAVGLEVRVPFLDHRVIEFLSTVDNRHKIAGFEGKKLLRSVGSGLLTGETTQRRKKPFAAPTGDWLKKLEAQYLNDSALVKEGIFNRDAVDRVKSKALIQGAMEQLWSIVVLEIWYRIFIKRDLETSPMV